MSIDELMTIVTEQAELIEKLTDLLTEMTNRLMMLEELERE